MRQAATATRAAEICRFGSIYVRLDDRIETTTQPECINEGTARGSDDITDEVVV